MPSSSLLVLLRKKIMTMRPLYTMPLPPHESSPDYPYYQAFLHSMNRSEGVSIADKIAQAIDMTADFTQTSSAHIARLLVDYGLRAPRNAFPPSFVQFIETPQRAKPAYAQSGFEQDASELKDFWLDLMRTQQPAPSMTVPTRQLAETIA